MTANPRSNHVLRILPLTLHSIYENTINLNSFFVQRFKNLSCNVMRNGASETKGCIFYYAAAVKLEVALMKYIA